MFNNLMLISSVVKLSQFVFVQIVLFCTFTPSTLQIVPLVRVFLNQTFIPYLVELFSLNTNLDNFMRSVVIFVYTRRKKQTNKQDFHS